MDKIYATFCAQDMIIIMLVLGVQIASSDDMAEANRVGYPPCNPSPAHPEKPTICCCLSLNDMPSLGVHQTNWA